MTELENRSATHALISQLKDYNSSAYDTDAAHPIYNHSGNEVISKESFGQKEISFIPFPCHIRAGLAAISELGAICLKKNQIQFVMTHLNFGEEQYQNQRIQQMRHIQNNLDKTKPYVIMGDFNEKIDQNWLQKCNLEEAQIAFENTPTCTNRGKNELHGKRLEKEEQIDNLIFSGLKVTDTKVEFLYSDHGELLSDHALCLVTIEKTS